MRARAAQILRYIVICLDFVHCFMTTAAAFPRSIRNYGMPSSDMSVASLWTMTVLRKASLALAFTLSVIATGYAQSIAPFDRLAGQWSGSGTIELSNGTHESIRCRAAYDALHDQRKLQLNIRCASESFNFDLRASATIPAARLVATGASRPATSAARFPARPKAIVSRSWPDRRLLPQV